MNTFDLTRYRSSGEIAEPTPAPVDHPLQAEIKRIDDVIATYELRIEDWDRVRNQMTTVEGHDFLADAIERDKFKLNHARMYRTVLERKAKGSAQ